MPNQPVSLHLAFELERGGGPEAQDEPPTVWRVDEPLRSADLQRRFETDWAAWYGPVLAPHAGAITSLLAEEAALALRLGGLPGTEHPRVWGGPLQQPDRQQRVSAVPLPLWWALPVVRKRSRRLRLLPGAVDCARLLRELQPVLAPEWRGQQAVSLRLEFETRMYWGAQAEPDSTPGGVRWLPCRVRSDGLACSAQLCAGQSAPPIERRLRGGVGLLVLQPLLVLERASRLAVPEIRSSDQSKPAPPDLLARAQPALAGRLRQGWQQLQQRIGYLPPQEREPALAQRWRHDEAWWSRAWPAVRAPDPALRRALQRGALLRPANQRAWRHGDSAQSERMSLDHVLLLHGLGATVRSAFADALATDPSPEALGSRGTLWPGLPLLDAVATWRFEHDAWQPLAASVARLAKAIERRILAPGSASATGRQAAAGGRLVLLAQGQGGLLARLLLDGWRERWAARGWRLEVITLGSPHLGSTPRLADDPVAQGLRQCLAFGALDPVMAAAALAFENTGQALAADACLRQALAERVRQERWWAGAPPPGLADTEPEALRRLVGGDLKRLPRGMWLLGSVWRGADSSAGPPAFVWLADEPAHAPGSCDGAVSRQSALAGRQPMTALPGLQRPSDDGVLAFDVSPAAHGHYLSQPVVRQLLQRALMHLLGREGSWA